MKMACSSHHVAPCWGRRIYVPSSRDTFYEDCQIRMPSFDQPLVRWNRSNHPDTTSASDGHQDIAYRKGWNDTMSTSFPTLAPVVSASDLLQIQICHDQSGQYIRITDLPRPGPCREREAAPPPPAVSATQHIVSAPPQQLFLVGYEPVVLRSSRPRLLQPSRWTILSRTPKNSATRCPRPLRPPHVIQTTTLRMERLSFW